jgi:predicted amidohydrolase
MTVVRAACIQLNSRDDMAANLAAAADWSRKAAEAGADLISLPEYASLMDGRSKVMLTGAFPEATHPALKAFRDLARELGRVIHVGSLTVVTEGGKPTNRGFVIGPDGAVLGRYDKIHMFDITLPDGREVFESNVYQPGNRAVVTDSSVGRLGLTVCYDVRFAELYRALQGAGAEIIFVPAAFMRSTGIDHWHSLVRARAIDTGAFVVAAAMCGEHGGGRTTFGHSLIVDPWGRILAEAGEEPGFIIADLDLAKVAETRANYPWLKPQPAFQGP